MLRRPLTLLGGLGVAASGLCAVLIAVAAGRRDGDDDSLAERPLVVRIDAAGCSPELAKSLRNRNIGYAVSARKTPGVEAAIRSVLRDPSRWHDALKHPKQRRGRAQAADLTDLADLSGWPTGTRLVVRREPRRPGAQRSLFPSDSFRCWGFLTDQAGHPARLDGLMHSHADVEDAAARPKDSSLARMPFTDWHANSARTALCLVGLMLVGWFQNACLTGPPQPAAPKRLR